MVNNRFLLIGTLLLIFSTVVYGVTESIQAIFLPPPSVKTVDCDDFLDGRIGEALKNYNCQFNLSMILPVGASGFCNFIVEDETYNRIIENRSLTDISTIKFLGENFTIKEQDSELKELENEYGFAEHTVSYPFSLYFKEDGIHRVIADLRCEFWESQNAPPIKVWDFQILSTPGYEEYKILRDQLEDQKNFNQKQIEDNERTYVLTIILAIGTVLGPIASYFISKDKKRIVDIEKMPVEHISRKKYQKD